MIAIAAAVPVTESAWVAGCIFTSVIVGMVVLWRIGQLDGPATRLKLAPFAIVGGLVGATGHQPLEDWYETRYSVCAQVVTTAELSELSGKALNAKCSEWYDTCQCRLGTGGHHNDAEVEVEDNFSLRDETLFVADLQKARAEMTEVSLPELPYALGVHLFDDGKRPVLLVEMRDGGRLRVKFAEGTSVEDAVSFVPRVLERKLIWGELVGR